MVLVIDNFDSFTYNLVQYLGELGAELQVYRNNAITIDEIRNLKPTHIVISPGPGWPKDAGISKDVVSALYKEIPILGVCLGHQCIGEVFGAKVTHAPYLMHGKSSPVFHNKKSIYKELSNPFIATRYHSLVLDKGSISTDIFEITAKTEDDLVMGIQHKEYPLIGTQFHPESILTIEGKTLLNNFLKL
jgi:anthranilate synthase/aminodeoxychorismate synthase-like glutamine amidotransferase